MKRSKIILIGIAGVFAAGAIASALYAPDKVEMIRRYVERKSRRFFPSLGDACKVRKDNIEDIKEG